METKTTDRECAQWQQEQDDETPKRQTVQQYIATLRQLLPAIEYQVDAWPYPQADQSHIKIYHPPTIPFKSAHGVYLVNSDVRGELLRVRNDAPLPSDLAKLIKQDICQAAGREPHNGESDHVDLQNKTR